MLQILDLILAGVMLISGLLAMMRGFTREVLSLLAWVVAGLAAWWALNTPELAELLKPYIAQERLAEIAAAGVVFLVVLILMSIVSVRLGDAVLDSAIGAFDRTLGLFYGLARGLLLVVIAYIFYIWLVPLQKHERWIREALSRPVVEDTAEIVVSFMPADIAQVISGKITQSRAAAGGRAGKEPAIGSGDKTRLDSLIESQQNKLPDSR